MRIFRRLGVGAIALLALCVTSANAHLMVSQRGTLNLVNSGVYMVMSIPASAFSGVDDDSDGKVSQQELRAHAQSIETQVRQGIKLESRQGAYPLDGLILDIAPVEDAPDAEAEQIVVLGRFPTEAIATDMEFTFKLFGNQGSEQIQNITVTRESETQLMMLTPKRNRSAILPSPWAMFVAQMVSGATHILSGPDHLLFLLVVLAGGWGFAKVVLALTCFTAGHAITLAASALWGLSVSPGIVEPAIAATIVGMALFDRYYPPSKQRFSSAIRLALVFACALIHGLGLADTFAELGLLTDNKLVSLAGFNTGIELGQIVVVLVATVLLAVIERVLGTKWRACSIRWMSLTALGLGIIWMVERIAAV